MLAALLALTMCACGKEETLYTPVREAEGGAKYSMAYGVTAENLRGKTDAAALIRIESWLSENETATSFRAKVLKCYHGDLPKTITFLQEGNSSFTNDDFPLADVGDEFLVFLTYGEVSKGYWSLCMELTTLPAVENAEGDLCALDCFIPMTELMNMTMGPSANQVRDEEEKAALLQNFAEMDGFLAEKLGPSLTGAYNIEELIDAIYG